MKSLKLPGVIGAISFAVAFALTSFIGSPQPFWASLIVGFLILEIAYYYKFNQQKRRMNIDG